MLGMIERGKVISDARTSLVAETCPNCHCWFAMPKSLYEHMRANSMVLPIVPTVTVGIIHIACVKN